MNVGISKASSLNLSKVAKLKDMMFRWGGTSIRWIITALQTVESEKLQRITIHLLTSTLRKLIYSADHQEWQDLDHLLVQFWTSHSIRPQVMCDPDGGGKDLRDHVLSLLPELTRRGLVDLVETPPTLRTTLTAATGTDIFSF